MKNINGWEVLKALKDEKWEIGFFNNDGEVSCSAITYELEEELEISCEINDGSLRIDGIYYGDDEVFFEKPEAYAVATVMIQDKIREILPEVLWLFI